MTTGLFVLLAALAAGATLLAALPGRPPLAFTWFVVGWVTGELAPFHLAAQAAVTVWAIAVGAASPVGLALMAFSAVGLLLTHHRARQAKGVMEAAVGAELSTGRTLGRLLRPLRFERPGVEVLRDLSYGPHGQANTLDVYRRTDLQGPAPTLVHIHGGSWMHGRKERQAKPLTWHLAEQGWVVVSVNYRLSPAARMPAHVEDVKAAVRWVRDHADALGVDPGFVVLTGGSAGGHLAALAALDPELDVQACVPHYGIYDLHERNLRGFLQKYVMPGPPDVLWDEMSPIARVHAGAPPFLVVHGTFDSMAYVDQARRFVGALRTASRQPVAYAELPGAQHAFDTFHSVRSTHVVDGVTRWLATHHHSYRVHQRASSGAATP
jgi:acetyl esterase/lipase